MPELQPRIPVLGYGNPGRRDDGLGPAPAPDAPGRTACCWCAFPVVFAVVVFAGTTNLGWPCNAVR